MLDYIFNTVSAPFSLDTIYSRAILAFFISLIISLSYGDKLISFIKSRQAKGQPIRTDGPQSHVLNKQGTPTMGGLLILGSSIISTLICARLDNVFVWVCILVLVIYGFVGFIDDYVKVSKQTANAMSAKMKLFLQFSTSLISVIVISYATSKESQYSLNIPYFKDLAINLSLFYIPFAMLVITGASNAVNLSDGLDGLASCLLAISFTVFMIFAFICGTDLSNLFYVQSIPNTAEISIVCSSVIGGLIGFLWFNSSPAKIFMGDTGSLALGALLGTIAVIIKQEILLAIVGGVFVIEALSVMIQVIYFKKTGKRFFKMAPIHHHFEQLGWAETKVVARFSIIALILGIIGLMALILR